MCAGNVRKSVGDTTKRQKEEENQRMRKGPDVRSEKNKTNNNCAKPPQLIHTTLTEHRVAILDSVVCLFCRIWMDRGRRTFLKFVPPVDATHLVEKMH